MQVSTIADANILKPNSDHKNFVETGEVIPFGTMLEGNEKYISGLRRGEAFTYKLFITNDKKIIYLNKIKPMANVEVTLGADGQVTPTKVDLINAESFSVLNAVGVVVGGISGYMYSKNKNHNTSKLAMYTLLGVGLGYAVSRLIKGNNKIILEKSK
jgi:hypothetical protein